LIVLASVEVRFKISLYRLSSFMSRFAKPVTFVLT